MGVEGMMEILSVMVVRLMQKGIIKGTSVSLDATIISAWFKDCRVRKDERHLKVCRHEKSKDRDTSWGYDHHRDRYVYDYKVHVLLYSQTALPLRLTVTMILKLGIHVKKFFADMGYDTNEARLLITQTLKAIPFISL
jgi:hypothetical protein